MSEIDTLRAIVAERLKRTVRVEQILLDVAAGRRAMLSLDEVRVLALGLGTPREAQGDAQRALIGCVEFVQWINDGSVPDADELVLVEGPDPGDVWGGCYDGEQWLTGDGMPVDVKVLAWATWPAGSRAAR